MVRVAHFAREPINRFARLFSPFVHPIAGRERQAMKVKVLAPLPAFAQRTWPGDLPPRRQSWPAETLAVTRNGGP